MFRIFPLSLHTTCLKDDIAQTEYFVPCPEHGALLEQIAGTLRLLLSALAASKGANPTLPEGRGCSGHGNGFAELTLPAAPAAAQRESIQPLHPFPLDRTQGPAAGGQEAERGDVGAQGKA